MRDPHDRVTAEIPGETPPPPPPRRITAGERRISVVYQEPRARAGCRDCRHRHDELKNCGSFAESFSVRCKLHDFTVQLGGICADHEE
jgi:hypothetical protein